MNCIDGVVDVKLLRRGAREVKIVLGDGDAMVETDEATKRKTATTGGKNTIIPIVFLRLSSVSNLFLLLEDSSMTAPHIQYNFIYRALPPVKIKTSACSPHFSITFQNGHCGSPC